MNSDDLKIYQKIKTILNRFSVDTNRVRLTVIQGNVDLTGYFTLRLSHAEMARFSIADLQNLMANIHEQMTRIQGAGRVKLAFENWERGPDGTWTPKRK